MDTNFSIASFTEIEFQGVLIDLHNCYDFIAESIHVDKAKLSFEFRKTTGEWIQHVEFSNLYFVFKGLNYLKQIEPDIDSLKDDACLSGITFYDADLRDEDYNFIERNIPNKEDDIIFSFESDRLIRINCNAVILIVQ